MADRKYKFDETFLAGLKDQQDRNERDKEFQQKLQFEMRQQSLLGDYRNQVLRNDVVSNVDRNFVSANGMDTSLPTTSGEDLNKQYGMNVFNPTDKFLDNSLIPKTPKVNDFTLTPGSTRFDPNGNPIAHVPPNPRATTSNEKQKESESQAQYNAIMGSPWLSMDEIKTRGLINNLDPNSNVGDKYGGAYVYQTETGKPILFYSDKELENYAKRRTPKAPNKWMRTNNDDPLGIR